MLLFRSLSRKEYRAVKRTRGWNPRVIVIVIVIVIYIYPDQTRPDQRAKKVVN
jgi:hypothetical protein